MDPMSFRSLSTPGGRQQGFSLIEVLVSMFIVSLGILALSGLMQASSRYGKTSELRATATLLANDIADHIRANAAGAHAGTTGYNLGDAYTSSPSITAPTPDSCPTFCTPDDLAAVDLYAFRTRLKAMLPGGNAFLLYHAPVASSNAKGSVDVWVAWTDPSVSPSTPNERPASECAAGLGVDSNYAVRCVYLQAGL
jgi:type IV pilus assembly protein PilV